MKIVNQERNAVYQLYRKDELKRLKRKIEDIKCRKPLVANDKNVTLPKIINNRSFSNEKINQIKVENTRLNKKILENMGSLRKSGLDLITTSEVTRVYKSSFSGFVNLNLRTSRKDKMVTEQDKQNGWAGDFTKRGLPGNANTKSENLKKMNHNNLRTSRADEIIRNTQANQQNASKCQHL